MTDVSRRAFLGGAVALGAGGLLAACGRDDGGSASSDGGAPQRTERFHGPQQHGIASRPAPAAGLIALDAVAPTVAALAVGFRVVSDEIRAALDDDPVVQSVNASVGASLFDDRYGLAARAPRELVTMPAYGNDDFGPDAAHGDVLVSISAGDADAVERARTRLEVAFGDAFVQRWSVAGGNDVGDGATHPRNAMGFHDGTSNPPVDVPGRMRQVVWVQPRDDEPEWASDGTYQVVRVIRMDLDRWSGIDVDHQERVMGRRKESGAPLGGGTIDTVPNHREDPEGMVTPLDAHNRLANPRSESIPYDEILRRGFSYTRVEPGGTDVAGLAFVCYQRRLSSGFLDIQARLEGEPLEEFTTTEGGGFYFVLPGVLDSDDWLGRTLLS